MAFRGNSVTSALCDAHRRAIQDAGALVAMIRLVIYQAVGLLQEIQ